MLLACDPTFFRSVLDASRDCIKVVELDGRLSYMNAGGLCLMEIDDFTDVADRLWWELWPADAAALVRGAVEAARQGIASRFEAFCPTAKGAPKWWDVSVAPILDARGKALRMVSSSRDISERKRAMAALEGSDTPEVDSQRRLEAIVNSIDQMIWSTRPDGYHDYYNARWYEFTGVPPGSTDGEAWNGMFHPEDQERAWAVWRHSLATGEPYHIEYRLRHRSGQYRWVIGRAQPVRGADGRIVRWYGTCTDVHDLKTAEEQRELIAHELSHRIKNIFAVIGGIISITARGFPQARDFADTIRARIAALGRAHDYVRPHGPESAAPEAANVHGLIAALLKPYQIDGDGRISVDGGDVPIGPRAATAMALVIHELATNAVKYGALSVPGGKLRINCEADGDTFRMNWLEENGPRIAAAPAQSGFGSQLSQRVAAGQLGARIEQDWNPAGLRFRIDIPVSAIIH
ncbi:PAS domain S-box-containing protein [Tepidamorphus gemmatus]|uniref:Blue-light-activated histidine kinase n=2 Tax=Tepidamorphus gemmatus TaxID=747076 RepID=A0A4R3MM42_9HYPH|nr:PAS domain S-box-containing protein [Tepidamorphus gemmatus]